MSDANMTENITRDKVISDLEKLKLNISQVEAHYQVLGHDFSRLCDEILTSVKTFQEPQQPAVPGNSEIAVENPVIYPINSASISRIGEDSESVLLQDVIKPVNKPKKTVTRTRSTRKRRVTAGLSSKAETGVKPDIAGVNAKTASYPEEIYPTSIHDIITNYANHHEKVDSPPVSRLAVEKSVIDKMADGIETGLDKLGDGLMYPVVQLVNLVNHWRKPG